MSTKLDEINKNILESIKNTKESKENLIRSKDLLNSNYEKNSILYNDWHNNAESELRKRSNNIDTLFKIKNSLEYIIIPFYVTSLILVLSMCMSKNNFNPPTFLNTIYLSSPLIMSSILTLTLIFLDSYLNSKYIKFMPGYDKLPNRKDVICKSNKNSLRFRF